MYPQRWLVTALLAVVIQLWLVDPGQCDMPFDSPERSTAIRCEHLFDYPEYDFYLKYGRSPGNPYGGFHLMKVETASFFRLEGGGRRYTPVYLVAVPRGKVLPPLPQDS